MAAKSDSSAEIIFAETGQMDGVIVLPDQAGLIRLVRRLYGLGMTILQFQIITRKR